MKLPGFVRRLLEERRVKKKRERWWTSAQGLTKRELAALFPDPDPELVDLIVKLYLQKPLTALDVYSPIYANGRCALSVKELLANHFLELAKNPEAGRPMIYMGGSNSEWTHPLNGRVRHLLFIGKCLPQLQGEIRKVVSRHLSDREQSYFVKHVDSTWKP